ncbi:hypothetical protein K402DRAFT_400557 [Aulographum hederae CBS 113979]|uniref:Uncharacterized protein n=1 Tax=Aulographum hederae CBS 113979 TaxID=1176131 RepID=A0A6G1HDD1_9PEZI|nr:hypothetical protein K402DRAFT_400557 [Aulographum hederae CBS 113979]
MSSHEMPRSSEAPSTRRVPKRRSQYDTGDSARQQPKKRSKLSDETFVPPNASKHNGNGTVAMNGHASQHSHDSSAANGVLSIPVREKKHATFSRRSTNSDDSAILTKNALFSVKQLPPIPSRLRDVHEELRPHIQPRTTLTLTLTHERAFIWDYASSSLSPDTLTFTFPTPYNRSEPQPLGALVASPASSDTGLVAIAPTTGRIAYWDNVAHAESLSRFQQRQAAEGSVGSLQSGEKIVEIIHAEHAGFVLRFSTGRLMQLTLRDSQGRPNIHVQLLSTAVAEGGLFAFGGLKNRILANWYQKDVVAVKTQPAASRGHMEVVALTGRGEFLTWTIQWAGPPIFQGEYDGHKDIVDALQTEPASDPSGVAAIKVLDFAFMEHRSEKGNELSFPRNDNLPGILLLVTIARPQSASYALLEVDFARTTLSALRVLPLEQLSKPPVMDSVSGVKLLLPKPQHTAFVVFDRTVLLVSLAHKPDSPDDQLLSEADKSPKPYQDMIHLRNQDKNDIVTAWIEEPGSKNASSNIVLFTHDDALLRIETNELEDLPDHVSVKSKLEQALFFGLNPANALDLMRVEDFHFPIHEIEAAAIALSYEILSSSTAFPLTSGSSMDSSLEKRIHIAEQLATILMNCFPPLSDATRWSLLWHAEKLAAARALWACYDSRRKVHDLISTPLVSHIVNILFEKYTAKSHAVDDEVDPLRRWFMYDVNTIEKVVPWAYQAVNQLLNIQTTPEIKVQLTSEADDITFAILETAFNFRAENCASYGIHPKTLHLGVLEEGYQGLTTFWTSTLNTMNAVSQLAERSRNWAFESHEVLEGYYREIADKVLRENFRLVKLACLTRIERANWLFEQSDEAMQRQGRSIKETYDSEVRPGLILGLAEIGYGIQGMQIAEELNDLVSLVELCLDEIDFSKESLRSEDLPAEQKKEQHRYLIDLKQSVAAKFTKYGDEFAQEYYTQLVKKGRYADLLRGEYGAKESLAKFFSANPYLSRLGWIQAVLEKDYFVAQDRLMNSAMSQELNTWCREVQLAMAQLNHRAYQPLESTDYRVSRPLGVTANEASMRLSEIQQRLFDHVQPTVIGALDAEAAIDLLMQTFARQTVAERPALHQLLYQGFSELLSCNAMAPELLIDVLTLMDQTHSESDEAVDDICGKEFVMALQALDDSDLMSPGADSRVKYDAMQKLIWKRAYLRDDWKQLNETRGLTDKEIEKRMLETSLANTFEEALTAILQLYGAGDVAFADKDPTVHSDHWKSHPDPIKCLGAGTDARVLAARFSNADLRDPILADNKRDDDLLLLYVNRGRLPHWMEFVGEVKVAAVQKMVNATMVVTDALDWDGEVVEMLGEGGAFQGDVFPEVVNGEEAEVVGDEDAEVEEEDDGEDEDEEAVEEDVEEDLDVEMEG